MHEYRKQIPDNQKKIHKEKQRLTLKQINRPYSRETLTKLKLKRKPTSPKGSTVRTTHTTACMTWHNCHNT